KRLTPLLGKDLRRVLVYRAEGIAAPVGTFQGEADALHRADLPHWCETPRVGAQVQNRSVVRGGPKRAVPFPEVQLVVPARFVLGASRDHAPCRRRPGVRIRSRLEPARRACSAHAERQQEREYWHTSLSP